MQTELNRTQFQPSGLNDNFNYKGDSFSRYIEVMRDIVEQARLDLTDENRELIIDANTPFEWIPPNGKSGEQTKKNGLCRKKKYKNGILLVHGLFDSPYTMLSIANYFREQGFLVRAILLPGHGTVPGDLISVTYHEWIKATNFGVSSFSDQVDNLFLCGFSTGGALSLLHALRTPKEIIKGLILIAPAIKLHTQLAIISNINTLMRSTIGGIEWYVKSKGVDYAKYPSFTFNSAHQVYLLTKSIKRWNQKNPLEIPVFIAATANDEVLSTSATLDFFNAIHSKIKHCIVYTDEKINSDKGVTNKNHHVEFRKSSFPEKNILNFSHVSIPNGPNHPHYGEHSAYHDFQHYVHPVGKRYKHIFLDDEKKDKIFLGAITPKNLSKYHMRRLTWNPDFDHMMKRIGEFVGKALS